MNDKNNQSYLNFEEVEQLKKDFEFARSEDLTDAPPTRASVKRDFANLNEETLNKIQETITQLENQLGMTDTKLRYLSQSEIDDFVEELLTVRKANDILSSREEVLKAFAKQIISMDQMDPDTTPGSIVSTKHKVRISKEFRGGKPQIDVNLLKARLTEEQFKSVTDIVVTTITRTAPDGKIQQETTTTYEVNEKYLEEEMVKGNILSEDVFLSSVLTKRTTAIYIRDLEE